MRTPGSTPTSPRPDVFPHPNRLPRWLHRLLIGSGGLLLLSGLGWELLHDTLGAGSAEFALPHPGEHWLMRLHGLVALAFLLALGGLGPVHLPRGWRSQRNRLTGLLLIGTSLLLIGSGYALSYFAGDASRRVIGLAHTVVGVTMALLLLLHRRSQIDRRAGLAAQPDSLQKS